MVNLTNFFAKLSAGILAEKKLPLGFSGTIGDTLATLGLNVSFFKTGLLVAIGKFSTDLKGSSLDKTIVSLRFECVFSLFGFSLRTIVSSKLGLWFDSFETMSETSNGVIPLTLNST